jgi:hypothetical protein
MSERVRCERLEGRRHNEIDGREWPWGPVTKVHYIGDHHIAIVEFRMDLSGFGPITADRAAEHGTTQYQPYIMVDGHGWYDTQGYMPSLDAAIVAAIAYRREGEDDGFAAARMFERMTRADRPQAEHHVSRLADEKRANREAAAARLAAKS